jgi:hypothetical protein
MSFLDEVQGRLEHAERMMGADRWNGKRVNELWHGQYLALKWVKDYLTQPTDSISLPSSSPPSGPDEQRSSPANYNSSGVR